MKHLPFNEALEDCSRLAGKVPRASCLDKGDFPVIGQGKQDVEGFTNDSSLLFRGALPVILFGDHTAAFKFIDHAFARGADGTKLFRPRTQLLDAKFTWHFLQTVKLPDTGYDRKTKYLENLKIPLPLLEEQRRIAAILDRANWLQQLSQANLQSFAEIERKVFSDMFGDPVSNERGWNTGCIGDFVAKFEAGKSLGSGEGDVSDSLRIIRVSAVSSGNFKPEESKPAPRGYVPPPNHFVQEGDLLFCRANTSTLIGEVAYVAHEAQDLLLSDKIWRFHWSNQSESKALYVQQLFKHPSVRCEIKRRSTGTSGSMLNISKSSVLSIPIILPPADLQRKFQAISAECSRLILLNTKQTACLKLLSYSLNRNFIDS